MRHAPTKLFCVWQLRTEDDHSPALVAAQSQIDWHGDFWSEKNQQVQSLLEYSDVGLGNKLAVNGSFARDCFSDLSDQIAVIQR